MKPDTRLAYDRTRLAYERTMMAWIRTGASMITFGFTVYKFFEIEYSGVPRPGRLVGPRGFAIILVCMGLVSLFMGAVEYRSSMRSLMAECQELRPSRAAPTLAWLLSLVGGLALFAVILRK
jgi:putative membrane protein